MAFAETLEKEWTLNGLTKSKFSRNNNSPLSDSQLISHPMRSFDRGALFELFCMLHVDDADFVFESRHQLETGTPLLLRHFAKFGLEMHIEKEKNHSKTECVFFPTPGYFTLPTLPNSDASTTTSPYINVKVKQENEKQKRQREDKQYDNSPDTTTIKFKEGNVTFTRHFKYLRSYIS